MTTFANSGNLCIHKPRRLPGTGLGHALAVLLLLYGATAWGVEQITIPPGDVAALQEAIERANAATEQYQLIITNGLFEFGRDQSLPPIVGDVEIIPTIDRIVFRPANGSGGPDQLIRVEPGGRLVLRRLVIEGFSLTQRDSLIENHGDLVLESLNFESLTGLGFTGGFIEFDNSPVISNHGRLVIERTTFLNVQIAVSGLGVQSGILTNHAGSAELREVLSAESGAPAGIIANRGGLVRIINATLAAQNATLATQGPALLTEDGAITELVNTIIPEVTRTDSSGPEEPNACIGPVVSLGHNLVEDTSCALDGPEDIEGQPTGLLPLRLLNFFRRTVPVFGLTAASPGVDSADPAFCGEVDILGIGRDIDGNGDGLAQCDRGAVELAQRRLTDGGINGVYFVPERDGHYITVLDNPNNVLVIWNTFDRDGNQAWVYAVGELVNGRSVFAEAYTNEGGIMTDMGPADIERGIPWGTLTLELESCTQGTLLFDSLRPEFGSGQFQFQRLASTRQLGCRDD
ncbi:MAG: hypothetical protein RQ847_07885 [Wenzhouxiangellaceae bacterium]|nr:hypothetical protein [Wenzhouxiangellaceae bacterium]